MGHARSSLIPLRLLAGLILLVVIVSCGGRLPATHYYVLELNPGEQGNPSGGSGDGIAVGVKAFRVDPPYDQDQIVYRLRERSSEVGFYAYHRWAAPLSRMLPVVVADGLAGTVGLRAIEPVVAGREYDAYLVGRVLALEESDHRDGQDVRLRLALELRLPDGVEIWSRTVEGQETIDTDDVGDIVERMNEVLRRVVSETRDEFAESVRRVPAGDKRN